VIIKITIKNGAEIRRTFQEAPFAMIRALNVAIEKSILAIENDAKKMAPVNKSPTVTGGTSARVSDQ